MSPVYVEMLMGHDLGLKTIYSRPTAPQLLEDNGDKVRGHITGINSLTINEENRLRDRLAEQDYTIKVELAHQKYQ